MVSIDVFDRKWHVKETLRSVLAQREREREREGHLVKCSQKRREIGSETLH